MTKKGKDRQCDCSTDFSTSSDEPSIDQGTFQRRSWVNPHASVRSCPAPMAFKMVAKFDVAGAALNEEFFKDNVVNFIEFSNDRIPMLIINQQMVLIWIKRYEV